MLSVNTISFQYQPNKSVLKDIHFQLEKGEHLYVMGESGCGKSTLLKAIYGLIDLDKGSIFWNDTEILGPEEYLVPGMDFIKHVAQDFDLMPFITVSENIKKFLSRFYPEESQKRTEELLEVIEMTEFADTMVKTLSGGQQQRVAIARALAKEPEIILLDEPFSQIDNFKKNSLRRKLFNYLKENGITCIVATHDGDDALSFADIMLVIKNNKTIALDKPVDVYNNPKSKYIASLFDDVNEIEINGKTQLLYPHQTTIADKSENKAIVLQSYYKGFYWLIEAEFKSQKVYIKHSLEIEAGKNICLSINT
jgi:ABC-type Fe3+/spermidine/putrescine transport system ATPase subunit